MARGKSRRPGNPGGADRPSKSSDAARRTPDDPPAAPGNGGDRPTEGAASGSEADRPTAAAASAPAAKPSPATPEPGASDRGEPAREKPAAPGTPAAAPKAAEERPVTPGAPAAGAAATAGSQPPPLERPRAAGPSDGPPRPPPDRPGSGPAGPPPAAQRGGLGAGLAGGVVGGALVALLAFLFSDQLTGAPDQRAAFEGRMDERLAALESRLDERLTALEARETPVAAPGPVEDRLRELETALQELRQAGEFGAIDLSGMAARLATLEAAATGTRETLEALTEPDLQPLSAGLAALTDELEATRAEVAQSAEAARAELAELQGRVETLAEPVAAVPELTTRVASLADRVEDLDARLADVAQVAAQTRERLEADDRRVRHALALALATTRVHEALRGTEPLAGAVDVLAPVAEADAEVAAAAETLRAAAAAGVPTLAELRRTFPGGAIARAAADADDRGLLEEAADNVLGLVTVRRRGAPANGVEGAVARAEARLADGDLAGAVAEVEGLNGEPAQAAADWLERARGRLAAEAAAADLQARTNELLGASL